MPTYELTCTACGTRFERFLDPHAARGGQGVSGCGSTDVEQGVGGGYVSRPSASGSPAGGVPRAGGFG